ncbi:hypothetical protein [Lacinutrix sp. Hel_I_90]|uniref:hypothetical protein n=1 Tax=Lacinutrix sp. Hel_I_90 TaxID=1249999 RepID=UPI0009E57F0B|nr:hypothetical protein [Lacinutrix sp. Hel_I_90]
MKTLKITAIALFSIGLLTAVLPSDSIEPTVESSNHEISKPAIDLTAMIEITNGKRPSGA